MILNKSKRIKQLETENELLKQLLQFYISLNKLIQMKQDLENVIKERVQQNYTIPIGLN